MAWRGVAQRRGGARLDAVSLQGRLARCAGGAEAEGKQASRRPATPAATDHMVVWPAAGQPVT